MSIPASLRLRGVSGGLRLFAQALEGIAVLADQAELSVSWEFAIICGILLAQKRFVWFTVVFVGSLIAAVERGEGYSLSLRWIESVSSGAAGLQLNPQLW